MAKNSRHMARRAAVQALYQWQLTGQSLTALEDHFILDPEVEGIDQDYFRQLVREIPRVQGGLDADLAPFLDRTIDEVDPVERAILRLGAYELRHRVEVPYRVVINEAIELAKTFGAEQGHKYVNAVLDRLAPLLRAAEMGRPSS